MKRIILSTLLAFSLNISIAQDMTPEQLEALEQTAKELHPSNENQRNAWIRTQKVAFDSIKFANYALSEDEVATIKADAQVKFPNNYIEQEAYVRTQASDLINLNQLSSGIAPEEFEIIKSISAKEAKGDPNAYMNLIRVNIDTKNKLQTLQNPKGVDEIDFKIIQRIIEKNYQYNYRKQYEAIAEKSEMLLSIMGVSSSAEEVAESAAALKDDPNAYNTIGLEVLKNHTLVVGYESPKNAIAVNFKGKTGFFCPLSAYSDELELITPTGERIEIEKIHISKTAPVMFLEVAELPSNISPIEMTTIADVKANLTKPLTLAGYVSATKPSCNKIAISAIRDDKYILNNKTPFNFVDGTMLLDYETAKLVSFTLRSEPAADEIPSFKEKSKVLAMLRKTSTTSRSALVEFYPILDMLENFELLDPAKMKLQSEFLENLKADNEEAFKLYTTTTLNALNTSTKYGKLAKDNISKFDGQRLGEKTFMREAKSLISKLVGEVKKDENKKDFNVDLDTSTFYVNLRPEITKQVELRKQLINYFQDILKDNNIESILFKDIISARQEPNRR